MTEKADPSKIPLSERHDYTREGDLISWRERRSPWQSNPNPDLGPRYPGHIDRDGFGIKDTPKSGS